jgi:hypothetical protein
MPRSTLFKIAAPLVLLVGCAGKPFFQPRETAATQRDAAAINIAVTQVAPWSEYVQALSPNFELTASAALTAAIPTTALLEQRLVDALVGSVGIGTERTSTAATRTVAVGTDGTETASSTATRTTSPGEIADVAAPGSPSVQSTLAFPTPPPVPTSDAMLRYSAATALFQEVQLLNRYVRDAALRTDYVPYIARIQLEVLPFARRQPYDVYAALGFFACTEGGTQGLVVGEGRGDCGDAESKLLVLPLLVTDNLENTLANRTASVIRQLSLALNVLQSGDAGMFGLRRSRERLDGILAYDTNSLLTVGRVTDNTLSARFGAPTQATAGQAMVPRTHNLTLLIMVPSKWVQDRVNNAGRRIVRVVGHWTVRHAETGQLLETNSSAHFTNEIDEFLRARLGKEEWAALTNRDALIADLQNAVFANDLMSFERALCAGATLGATPSGGVTCQDSLATGSDLRRRDLWMAIVQELQLLPDAGARFELPPHREYLAPPDQSIMLVDNKLDRTVVTLRDGRGLIADDLAATLKLKLAGAAEPWPVLAESVTVDATSTVATLRFPSIAMLNIGQLDRQQGRLVDSQVELCHRQIGRWVQETNQCSTQNTTRYGHVLYREAPANPAPLYAVRYTVTSIKPANATGSLDLHVELQKDGSNKPLINKLEIGVSGATLSSATLKTAGSSTPTTLPVLLGRTEITADGSVTLGLGNVGSDGNVTITTTPKDQNGNQQGPALGAIVFPVK